MNSRIKHKARRAAERDAQCISISPEQREFLKSLHAQHKLKFSPPSNQAEMVATSEPTLLEKLSRVHHAPDTTKDWTGRVVSSQAQTLSTLRRTLQGS
jgi:hypothetical protein